MAKASVKKEWDIYPNPYLSNVCEFHLKNGKVVTGQVRGLGWDKPGSGTFFFFMDKENKKPINLDDIEDIIVKEKKKSVVAAYSDSKDGAFKFLNESGVTKTSVKNSATFMRKVVAAELVKKFKVDEPTALSLIDDWVRA